MYTIDIETNGLLNEETVDYTASPYKLKDNYVTHCIVLEDQETGEIHAFYDGETIILDGRSYRASTGTDSLVDYSPVEYQHHPLSALADFPLAEGLVGHNIINFDLLSLKLSRLLDYTVGPDTINGEQSVIHDTYVLAKTLNPGLKTGYSLDNLGRILCKARKYEFRKEMPEDERFKVFGPDMLYYCIQDVKLNTRIWKVLEAKLEEHGCHDAYELEKSVKDIVTMQEHRGFKFDSDLAHNNVQELDELMEQIRSKVEPHLPQKRMTKVDMTKYTPPKVQFKKDGTPSAKLLGFIERHGGEFVGDKQVRLFGEVYELPLPKEPLVTTTVSNIEDTTVIKNYLIERYDWEPTEWNSRDITMFSDKKRGKLPPDKYRETVERYIKTAREYPAMIPFKCGEHGVRNLEQLESKLLLADTNRPVFVLTTPSFTVGQQKEFCPDLLRVAERAPFVKQLTAFFTHRHRRTSILGGKFEWDDPEPTKGFLSQARESDGRIPTPADSCGTGTTRFTHKGVANIPRVSSTYGEKMRRLFGVDDDFVQIGYDFDGLEARIESHYCWPFDDDEHSYCHSLTQEKPNDVHTKTAAMISKIIGQDFGRTPAKTVKYACAYGAQPKKLAKTIGVDEDTSKKVFDAYWKAAEPLAKFKEWLTKKWKTGWNKKYILSIDGRRIPTRSAHSLVNFQFQSAGVICAKRAMVIHRDKLKKAGLYVDFFKDDWKSKKFCSQLIAYHDEAQLEVHKSLVKGKLFKTEEEAKKWKADIEKTKGVILSDVRKVDNGWFVGYTLAGELAVEAVREAGEYYNLHVDLTAGYMLGKNWAECH